MNTRPIQYPYLIPVFLALLSACGGGGGGGGNDNTPGPPGTLQLAESSYDAAEGTVVNILVNRSGGNSGVVSVAYSSVDGTAVGASDYNAANGTLTWADGVSGNQTISIPITDDNAVEPSESFNVTLSNVSVATLGATSSATVNIIDNDSANITNTANAPEALSAFGVVTALNDVRVNGVRYETNATNLTVNGLLANVSDLELGQIVALEGEIKADNVSGTAREIAYNATVIGPVESTNAALSRLTVMGQTVLTNADTVFAPSIDPSSFARVTVGSNAEISGFLNADGDIVATRIEPDGANRRAQIIGAVTELDFANMLFTLNGLSVDYGTAALIELPGGMPANGMFVIARGSLIEGILVVEEIESLYDAAGVTPGERAQVQGSITRYNSATDFDLNGFRVATNASTEFVNGTANDLRANAEITVDGNFSGNGGTIVASEISFASVQHHASAN